MSRQSAQLTAEPIAAGGGRGAEWLSISDTECLFSLSRTVIYELIASREIRSISLRKKGQQRGRRLVYTDSVRAYFEGLEEEQAAPVATKKPSTRKGPAK